jgi:hypothetical protein
MAAKAAIFVSKRLQRPALAILCLMMVQTATTLANCTPEPVAMGAARVAITR